jgi:hypothetical protein
MAALSRLLLAATLVVAACRARPPAPLSGKGGAGDDITIYRDAALIRQRIELDLPATPTTVKTMLASGVAADQIVVLDRGGLDITSLRAKTTPDDEEATTCGTPRRSRRRKSAATISARARCS